ncbi:unnamed protein product [Boreogadus saida]
MQHAHRCALAIPVRCLIHPPPSPHPVQQQDFDGHSGGLGIVFGVEECGKGAVLLNLGKADAAVWVYWSKPALDSTRLSQHPLFLLLLLLSVINSMHIP